MKFSRQEQIDLFFDSVETRIKRAQAQNSFEDKMNGLLAAKNDVSKQLTSWRNPSFLSNILSHDVASMVVFGVVGFVVGVSLLGLAPAAIISSPVAGVLIGWAVPNIPFVRKATEFREGALFKAGQKLRQLFDHDLPAAIKNAISAAPSKDILTSSHAKLLVENTGAKSKLLADLDELGTLRTKFTAAAAPQPQQSPAAELEAAPFSAPQGPKPV